MVALPPYSPSLLRQAQQDDSNITQILQARKNSSSPPQTQHWNAHPLRRYRQLWNQLKSVDGVLCHPFHWVKRLLFQFFPQVFRQIPNSIMAFLQLDTKALKKTLERTCQNAYWVSMARDVERYCRECTCTTCQQSKLSMPQRAPLTSMAIGKPWQMIAVDILEVPRSLNNNRYLLVVQDYITK